MKIDGINNMGGQSYVTTEVKSTGGTPDISTTAVTGENFSSTEESSQKNAPSESTVKQAISDINKKINPNTVAQYGYHEETNRVTIKIVDKDTDKVSREFPAEETLDMIAKVWELAGVFLDERG